VIRPYNKAEIVFDLVREIVPSGQNSKTYVAHDHQLDAEVFVKELAKTRLDSPVNFFDESKALYASTHPNVVQIHYACQDANAIYLVMPYYKRGSINLLMETKHLSVREIVSLGCQMLSGLHNIHSKKLVHFDIKPSNILLSDRGEALVADFGLAKQINRKGVAEQDRFYMRMKPPEGFRGHEHDVTFDIYQVGMTLYRMCNGNEAFEAQFQRYNQGTFDREAFRFDIQNGRFPDRRFFQSHIPEKLRKVIRKCLETDPGNRFQSALAVSNALADVDAALDWYFTETPDKRVWKKKVEGISHELTVERSGRSECYKTVNEGTPRRVKEACADNIKEKEIQKFLGAY
jgi:eukaryotic-like serine/threonine-protein kinase